MRTYVSVDGGMADNIRPALYGARYTAVGLRNSMPRSCEQSGSGIGYSVLDNPQSPIPNTPTEVITIAGKYCESGDILIRDIELPRLEPGDPSTGSGGSLLAIPMAGAYTLAMSSNYNLARRPAVALVKDGAARLIQRRESYADLVARDWPLHPVRESRRGFWKYHGLGNDYIVLDPTDWPEPPSAETIRRICDRHRGIGADGILWGPIKAHVPGTSEAPGTSFSLRLFNPDGSEFEKSGNGLRIFARYLWERGYVSAPDFQISTPGGIVTAHVLEPTGGRISLEMGTLSFDSRTIPVLGPPRQVVAEPVQALGHELTMTAATIGNPHCVIFVDGRNAELLGELTPQLAHTLGSELERLPLFPARTNVQFAQATDRHTLRVELWERGVGYTLASGTSACAVAAAAIRTGRCASPVTVQAPGGEMLVEVAADWSVRLTGTVGKVCEGVVEQRIGY